MKTKLLTMLIIISTASACTTKDAYNLIQSNRQSACSEDLNTHARDECLKGLNKDYSVYKRQRDALLKRGEQ